MKRKQLSKKMNPEVKRIKQRIAQRFGLTLRDVDQVEWFDRIRKLATGKEKITSYEEICKRKESGKKTLHALKAADELLLSDNFHTMLGYLLYSDFLNGPMPLLPLLHADGQMTHLSNKYGVENLELFCMAISHIELELLSGKKNIVIIALKGKYTYRYKDYLKIKELDNRATKEFFESGLS